MADNLVQKEEVQRSLFLAISEGRFDAIPEIAAAYRNELQAMLSGPNRNRSANLEHALEPLQVALKYLRIVRAHQATEFQRLATGFFYCGEASNDRIRTLDVRA